MKFVAVSFLLIALASCDLIRLLNTSEEKDESSEQIQAFLSKHKYKYDFSFENTDSTSRLLKTPPYRLIDSDSIKYSYIQLRVYDSTGNLYSGYAQCMGNFNEKRFIDSFPPIKNSHPFLNTGLKFRNELDLVNAGLVTKSRVLEEAKKYEYTFVVYWTIWTNSFSERVLREVSELKSDHPDKILVIFVNTARDVH